MGIGSVILAFITVAIDRTLSPDIFKTGDILAPNSIEGTRTILSIITGSMISIASGLTLSLRESFRLRLIAVISELSLHEIVNSVIGRPRGALKDTDTRI